MGNLRPVLIMGLVFLAYMMWVEWQKDYGPAPQTSTAAQTQAAEDASIPDVPRFEDSPQAGQEDLPQAVSPGPVVDASEGVPPPVCCVFVSIHRAERSFRRF